MPQLYNAIPYHYHASPYLPCNSITCRTIHSTPFVNLSLYYSVQFQQFDHVSLPTCKQVSGTSSVVQVMITCYPPTTATATAVPSPFKLEKHSMHSVHCTPHCSTKPTNATQQHIKTDQNPPFIKQLYKIPQKVHTQSLSIGKMCPPLPTSKQGWKAATGKMENMRKHETTHNLSIKSL